MDLVIKAHDKHEQPSYTRPLNSIENSQPIHSRCVTSGCMRKFEVNWSMISKQVYLAVSIDTATLCWKGTEPQKVLVAPQVV